jgi:hypothetical protein
MSNADRLFAKSVKDRALTLRQFTAIQVSELFFIALVLYSVTIAVFLCILLCLLYRNLFQAH